MDEAIISEMAMVCVSKCADSAHPLIRVAEFVIMLREQGWPDRDAVEVGRRAVCVLSHAARNPEASGVLS